MISSLAESWLPNPPNNAPKEIKTKLKPSTNKSDPNKTFPRLTEKPAAKDKYPGTNGRTHGERKEITPAIKVNGNAAIRDPVNIWSTKNSFIRCSLFQSSRIKMRQ